MGSPRSDPFAWTRVGTFRCLSKTMTQKRTNEFAKLKVKVEFAEFASICTMSTMFIHILRSHTRCIRLICKAPSLTFRRRLKQRLVCRGWTKAHVLYEVLFIFMLGNCRNEVLARIGQTMMKSGDARAHCEDEAYFCWLRMAMKMMSWRRIQHRRKEDADENGNDQQVRLMKLMKMWGRWGSGGWIEPLTNPYNGPLRVP